MPTIFFTGLITSLGLILAIGAQNAFLLRQGLRGEHVFVLAAICAASDAVLISAGVAGFGVVMEIAPWLEPVMRYGGALFVALYGLRTLFAAVTVKAGLTPADMPPTPLRKAVLACLAFTWLNPHCYLDTVVFLGSISTRFQPHEAIFGFGAMTGSFIFFFSLGYGAKTLRPLLASPKAWQFLDAGIGVTMLGIAARLATIA